MTGDLQNKSRQPDGAERPSIAEQKQIDIAAISGSSALTPEQGQILGNVYQLILGWRGKRLMTAKPSAAPAEREA